LINAAIYAEIVLSYEDEVLIKNLHLRVYRQNYDTIRYDRRV